MKQNIQEFKEILLKNGVTFSYEMPDLFKGYVTFKYSGILSNHLLNELSSKFKFTISGFLVMIPRVI